MTMMEVSLIGGPKHLTATVYGIPVQQGSMNSSGYGRVYAANDKKLRPWRKNVKGLFEQAMIDQHWTAMVDGPHGLGLAFYMPRPKTVTREYPIVPPDLDKLIRAIGDSSTDAGVVKDDSRYVQGWQLKEYALTPDDARVEITVWRVE